MEAAIKKIGFNSLNDAGLGLQPHTQAARCNSAGPVAKQFTPDRRESCVDPFALDDPLGEALYRVTPRLVRQYYDRALLKTTDRCFAYCRFCFRRKWVSAFNDGQARSFIEGGELDAVLSYLRGHPEVRELLLSGGDPLTEDDDRLEGLFALLRVAMLKRWRPLHSGKDAARNLAGGHRRRLARQHGLYAPPRAKAAIVLA